MNRYQKQNLVKKAVRTEAGDAVEKAMHAVCANIYIMKGATGQIAIRDRDLMIEVNGLKQPLTSGVGLAIMEAAKYMGYLQPRKTRERAWSLTHKGIDYAEKHPSVMAYLLSEAS